MTAVIVMACEKSEKEVAHKRQEVTINEIPRGHLLSSEFTIKEIKTHLRGDYFTLSDYKYTFIADVICCTSYKVGDKIKGYDLNVILSVNNYQIPSFK